MQHDQAEPAIANGIFLPHCTTIRVRHRSDAQLSVVSVQIRAEHFVALELEVIGCWLRALIGWTRGDEAHAGVGL
eukprot:scaffold5687_cov132-Isochrysis_galbana.AAC.4